MHNHLGSLVGIKFTMKDLKEEMCEDIEDLRNVYVAEVSGKVVGYMSFSPKIEENEFFGKYYHLYHMAVKPRFRRKGIATKLFATLLKEARKEQANIVGGTFLLNKPVLKFAHEMGFKPIETVFILDNIRRLKI
jgi:GNAT superfamily N-acetyltransferase